MLIANYEVFLHVSEPKQGNDLVHNRKDPDDEWFIHRDEILSHVEAEVSRVQLSSANDVDENYNM